MDNVEQVEHPPSGTQWTIQGGGQEAVVVEIGGGLRAYRVGGVDYLDGYGVDEVCPGGAGQVLAPWPNRIRDGRYVFGGQPQQLPLTEPDRNNAMHGLVSWLPWRLVERTVESVAVECELPAQPGYPWSLWLRTTWQLDTDGLRARHEVTNPGRQPVPFGLAVHPYLRLPQASVDDVVLRVPGRIRLLVDARMLPIGAVRVAGTEYDYTSGRRIGNARLDDAFGEVDRDPDGGSRVTLAAGDRAINVWADASFGWWQIFTGDTLPGARYRRSVAVEPMTCPADAFRSGRDMIVLEPGTTWSASWGILRPSGSDA